MLNDIENNVLTPSPHALTSHGSQPVPPQLSPVELRKGEPLEKPEILEEVVIEEISIDGMCGVY